MAKLNLNRPLVDEKGEQTMIDTNLAKLLGGALIRSASTEESDILKFYLWATELGKSGILDLDEADSKKLKNWLVKNEDVFIIVKAPILKMLDDMKFK